MQKVQSLPLKNQNDDLLEVACQGIGLSNTVFSLTQAHFAEIVWSDRVFWCKSSQQFIQSYVKKNFYQKKNKNETLQFLEKKYATRCYLQGRQYACALSNDAWIRLMWL